MRKHLVRQLGQPTIPRVWSVKLFTGDVRLPEKSIPLYTNKELEEIWDEMERCCIDLPEFAGSYEQDSVLKAILYKYHSHDSCEYIIIAKHREDVRDYWVNNILCNPHMLAILGLMSNPHRN